MAFVMTTLVLRLALVTLALAAQGECENDEGCSVNFVQLDVAKNLRQSSSKHWYKSRAVDYNRTGQSFARGPWPLTPPHWEYSVPGLNFHQTPCIDEEHNVYTGSDNGIVLSFDKHGMIRWRVEHHSLSCQNPFLYEGIVYTSCGDGVVLALSMEDGRILWSKKFCDNISSDTYSMTASKDHLFFPCIAREFPPWGAKQVVLVDRKTGDLLWKKDCPHIVTNIAPCMLEDSIVFNDDPGGVYRVKLTDGSDIWYAESLSPFSSTLGGVACKNGKVYNGFSTVDLRGGLSALDLQTGERLWTKWVSTSVHNAPSVGKIYGHDRDAVIFGMGIPTEPPGSPPQWTNGTLYASDVLTGEFLWSFEPPAWYGSGCAGSTVEQPCMPDLWSGATIDKDGTVYINWSAGGVTYALRDANRDGRVDVNDPQEVSSVDLGSGATGPPALAEQMLVVNTCRGPRMIQGADVGGDSSVYDGPKLF